MSMPAAADGKLFMVYPDTRGDRRHYLACFTLKDGKAIWKQQIRGEVITAPVLAGEIVYFTTLDGTVSCLRRDDGKIIWTEARDATSAPAVWNDQCYFSQRREVADADPQKGGIFQTEHLAARASKAEAVRRYLATMRKADYLDHTRRMRGSPRYAASATRDAAVDFAAAKGDAKIHMAQAHLGQAHVHSLWAYQGSKPFLHRGRLYAAHGDTVSCADPNSDRVYWKRTIGGSAPDETLLDSALTPPSIAGGKLFLGSLEGEIHCLCAESGELLWSIPIGEPVVFQPAVAKGWVYAGTDSGTLVGFATGDPTDDGWLMWGADAAHNGGIGAA
jgi:outer membrane protein assembly factor BamB